MNINTKQRRLRETRSKPLSNLDRKTLSFRSGM
jgi:hypothetical protein